MIRLKNVCKSFNKTLTVNEMDLSIKNGCIVGLQGNGHAGKSTTLRLIAGILRPDSGYIYIDGEPIWDNPTVKAKLFFISQKPYYYPNSTPQDLASLYQIYYASFDEARFLSYMTKLELHPKLKMDSYSTCEKKQLSILLGVCANTSYLLCDQIFDDLDTEAQEKIKKILRKEMSERQLTILITAQDDGQLKDLCDYIVTLHEGGCQS